MIDFRNYNTHQQRLSTMRPSYNLQQTAENIKMQQEYKKALRLQNLTFGMNEKNIELNRENAILLNHLVDISRGKRSSVHGPATQKRRVVAS